MAMLMLSVAAVALGFPLLSWAFGDAVLRRFTPLDRTERFAASFGVAFAVYAASSFLAFVTHSPQTTFSLLTLLSMLVIAVTLGRRSAAHSRERHGCPSIVFLWAAGYAHLICIQALLPNYLGGDWFGDWHMHYEEALIFRGELPLDTTWRGAGDYTIASRTPLFNLAAAFVLSLTGNEFGWFQVAAAFFNSCFLTALFLLLRDLFGLRAARFGLLLATVNLWMLHNAWFTWPKMLTAYYVLLGLHFYLQWLRRRQAKSAATDGWFIYFWSSSVLGYMTHQVAAVYLAVLVLHATLLLWRDQARKLEVRTLILLPVCALLVTGPWYLWLGKHFGLGRVAGSTPVTQMEGKATQSLLYVLLSIPCNLFLSVVPIRLADAFWDAPRLKDELLPWLTAMHDRGLHWPLKLASPKEIYQGVTDWYFSLLTGALTLSLCFFLLCSRFRKRAIVLAGTKRQWQAVWLFTLVGGLGAAALHPQRLPHGVAHSACFPSALLLTVLAWGLLSRAPQRWRLVVTCGIVAEFLLLFWSHLYLAHHHPLVLDPQGLNPSTKSEHAVVFLSESLGEAWYVCLVAALLVQLVVCVALLAPRALLQSARRFRLSRLALLR